MESERVAPNFLDLPPEILRIVAVHVAVPLCFALISQKCCNVCERRGGLLRSPQKAVCHGSLQLLEWAKACGCEPPREMSDIVASLDIDLDAMTAYYRDREAQAVQAMQLPNDAKRGAGAIVPPAGVHSGDVLLARTASGTRLARPRPLTAEELQQVVYCRPLLWTGECGNPAVEHQMWHVLFAADETASSAFTLSRVLDVIAYFVGYFKPRQRAAEWRHVSPTAWSGIFDNDWAAAPPVWLFRHTPRAPPRPSGVNALIPKVRSALGRRDATTAKLATPRRFKERARVLFDDDDEDLRHLCALPRGHEPFDECLAPPSAGMWWDGKPNGGNVHGHLVHFSPAKSRGDMLASMLAYFEI